MVGRRQVYLKAIFKKVLNWGWGLHIVRSVLKKLLLSFLLLTGACQSITTD